MVGGAPKSVAVIGAGVVGVAAAYALARRGIKVTLIDGHAGAGQGASYANGAQLSYLYTDALANRKLIRHMPALLAGCDPAFRFHWRWDVDYWRWLSAFLANCTTSKFRSNTMAAYKLAAQSRSAMEKLLDRHDLQFGRKVAGKMHLYSDQQSFVAARQTMVLKGDPCGNQLALSPQEAFALEPALEQGLSGLAGVIYSPGEEVGDAHLFATQMAALLVDKYDVRCQFGVTVQSIDQSSGRPRVRLDDGDEISSDHVSICAGYEAADLAKSLNVRLPIQPLKGYSFTAPPGSNSPETSITDVARRIVFTNLGNRIRVAGLADLGDKSMDADPVRMNALIDAAKTSLPDAVDYSAASEFWSGFRPMTPNSLPVISRPIANISINAGHGMLGWTMAMGSGERLAHLLHAN